MRYQSVLGNCNETTIGGMIKQCPETYTVFQSYSLDVSTDRDKTVQEAAAQAGVPGKTPCRQLFDYSRGKATRANSDRSHQTGRSPCTLPHGAR